MTRDAYGIPPWAVAILFWRKVLAVESKGIPAIRPGILPPASRL